MPERDSDSKGEAVSKGAKSGKPAPKRRKWLRISLLIFVVVLIAGVPLGYKGWTYKTTNPKFCVSCHIMNDAYERWRVSEHQDVICQTCHLSTVFDNMYQGYMWLVESPEKVGPHTHLSADVCTGCHKSGDPQWTQIAQTAGHQVHTERAGLSCLECHFPALHSFKPDVDRCVECHSRNAKVGIEKMEKLHCLECHNYLATGDESIKPGREQCLACHEKNDVKGGPFSTEFHADCTECHRVHQAPISVPTDCLACHKELLEGGAHMDDHRLTECLECHEPHTWKD